jgi:ketosteroid isomerase-like protein
MNHEQTVTSIYAAFGRGDVPSILAALSEDVAWEWAYSDSIGVPWLVPRRGPAQVGEFFQVLATQLVVQRFEVKMLLARGPVVVALFDFDATVERTGRAICERDEAHIWHFDAAGKVSRFRHAADTLQHARALAL